MKIGVLSMQEVMNYGSFLQAFSLKKILRHWGINATSLILFQGCNWMDTNRGDFTK